MDDLVKLLRKVDEEAMYAAPFTTKTLIDAAADRIEQLETAFGELMKAWEFWQSQETKNGFSELCAAYWDAKAVLFREKKDEQGS